MTLYSARTSTAEGQAGLCLCLRRAHCLLHILCGIRYKLARLTTKNVDNIAFEQARARLIEGRQKNNPTKKARH